jgi:hypothetical protein
MEPQARFSMGIPRAYPTEDRYAFWLTTGDKKLLAVVRSLNCVAALKRSRSTGRIVVQIDDSHDPDEAWHWIRAELEQAVSEVELDDIWLDAIKWIL